MQVLINLLSNAIKFTQFGGIIIGVAHKEQFADFFVTDTGEGIFPAEQEKIFDEFHRVLDNVPNQPAGTGLGLAICKKIVESHNGRIWVESSIGKGSTFHFTIPLFFEEEQAPTGDSSETSVRRHEKIRPILVVIRNTVKRMFLRKDLENVGYNTLGVTSFENACSLMITSPVDIIVTEVNSRMEEIEPLLTLAAAEKTSLYMSYYYAEPPERISLVMSGYIWFPFDRYQFLKVLEPFKMPYKKITIISPYMDESRMMQMVLGIEGYKTALASNDDKFINSTISFNPEVIIIGTFESEQVDVVVKNIRAAEKIANVPLILALKEPPPRNVKLVTLPSHGDRPLLFGLSPLVQKIEGELFK
jgi:CheY-like chemotaxis protein